LGVIFNTLDALAHMFFSNEMGLGKTKVFAATIECRARELERQHKAGNGKERILYPSLIVNSVSTVHQTHRELKTNFPGLTISLLLRLKKHSLNDSMEVLDKPNFERRMQTLSPTNPHVSLTLSVYRVTLTVYRTHALLS
jgi:hypothetical protein